MTWWVGVLDPLRFNTGSSYTGAQNMYTTGVLAPGPGLVMAFGVGTVLLVLISVLLLLRMWIPLDEWVFRVAYWACLLTLCWAAQSIVRMRLSSGPFISLSLPLVAVMLILGLVTALSAVFGFNGTRLLPATVASSALAPLMLALVQTIER
jgi:hypothetical protein